LPLSERRRRPLTLRRLKALEKWQWRQKNHIASEKSKLLLKKVQPFREIKLEIRNPA
jgi:hypothetical protein